MKKSYGVMLVSILFMLAGCLDNTSGTKFSLQGTGVDGYFKEATVCIDANENRACDSDETSTTTDENGDFTLPSINLNGEYVVLLLVGGVDIATNKAFKGEYKRIFEKSDFGTTKAIIINPLTDLVATSFLNLSDDNRTLSKIKEDVATQFAISVSDINNDPMQDITLFTKIQTAEQLKNILALSISKYLSRGQDETAIKEIIYSVSKAYAYEIGQNPNQSLEPILAKLFTTLEAEHKIEIPTDEKAFIVAQLQEIIKVIIEIQGSTDINISQLPKIQNGLELLLHSAYYEIEKDEIPAKGIVLSLETMKNASDADDIKILKDLASHIYDRRIIADTHGATVTYEPSEKKVATALKQVYRVTVSLAKRGQGLSTHFLETVEADETLKNKEDLALVTSIAGDITSRDISQIGLAGASVEFSREKTAIDVAKTYSVTATVTKGSQTAVTTFDEVIEASSETLTADQIAMISIANQIENRTLPSDMEGTTVIFSPTEKKSATAEDQSYSVLVDIKKGDINITIGFLETVAYDEAQYLAAIKNANLADIDDTFSQISSRVLPNYHRGVSVTFSPSHPKRPTRETQTYDVNVTVSKGGESKSKIFTETVSNLTTYEEDNVTVTKLRDYITSRDLSKLEIHGATITFDPLYKVSKEESYDSDVTVTITKGAAIAKTSFSETIAASNVYVAFSGGGWHSHTTLAGWLMGAMDAMDSETADSGNLVNLTKNVDALSCNSGGCWFATQLTFSKEFSSRLETQSNEEYLGTDGYLGQTIDIFKNKLDHWSTNDQFIRILNYSSNWSDFMKISAFKPFDMLTNELNDTTLDSPHLEWADTMPLIYASSLNTNTYVTSKYRLLRDNSKTYYEGGIAGKEEWLNGGSYRPGKDVKQRIYTPISLTSLGNSGSKLSPVFLEGDIKLRYAYRHTRDQWIYSDKNISSTHPTDTMKVFDAASASSAALGESANINYELSESAIGFEVTDTGFVHYIDDSKMNEAYADTAEKRRIRFSDGGYTDNTSVANMMKHLQENNLADNFKIVLFMNSSSTATSGKTVNPLQIPQSAAILFGKGYDTPVRSDGTIDFDVKVGLVSVPSADIFTEASWNSGKVYWKRDIDGTILEYVKFDVETKANLKFGIDGGSKGELHLFIGTMNASNAIAGQPFHLGVDKVLGTYEVMLKETRKGVTEEDGSWKYLKEALNL